MEKIEYFREMQQTSELVKPIMRRYLFSSEVHIRGLHDQLNYLTSTRIAPRTLLLKPFLVRLCYEVCGGTNWQHIAPVCAATELINISSYQANISLDGKHKVTLNNERNNQFIASFITREVAQDIINDISEVIGINKSRLISECLTISNRNIYLGQFIDLNVLVKDACSINTNFKNYLNDYIKRCSLLSGIFSEQCAIIGGVLANAQEELIQKLSSFGQNFGIGLHIVNDLGDFVPSHLIKGNSLRKPYDQFSDIKQGKLTLPLMYVLMNGSELQKELILRFIGHPVLNREDEIMIVETLKETGAINFSRNLSKDYYRSAKKVLNNLPSCRARSLLSVMLSQLRTNKYLYNLRGNGYPQSERV